MVDIQTLPDKVILKVFTIGANDGYGPSYRRRRNFFISLVRNVCSRWRNIAEYPNKSFWITNIRLSVSVRADPRPRLVAHRDLIKLKNCLDSSRGCDLAIAISFHFGPLYERGGMLIPTRIGYIFTPAIKMLFYAVQLLHPFRSQITDLSFSSNDPAASRCIWDSFEALMPLINLNHLDLDLEAGFSSKEFKFMIEPQVLEESYTSLFDKFNDSKSRLQLHALSMNKMYLKTSHFRTTSVLSLRISANRLSFLIDKLLSNPSFASWLMELKLNISDQHDALSTPPCDTPIIRREQSLKRPILLPSILDLDLYIRLESSAQSAALPFRETEEFIQCIECPLLEKVYLHINGDLIDGVTLKSELETPKLELKTELEPWTSFPKSVPAQPLLHK